VELVALVVPGNLFLRARRHGERIAIDLESSSTGTVSLAALEVGGIGEQETQRIAHAAIALHHVLQDLVGDEQLAE